MTALFLSEGFEAWGDVLRRGDHQHFLRGMGAQTIAKNARRSVHVFDWQGRRYFFKCHLQAGSRGLGIREWVWNGRFADLGIPVAKAVAAGESFFISEEIQGAQSVEKILDMLGQKGGRACRVPWALLKETAQIVATMHAARIAHKDLYLGHFFWDEATGRLSLIDLARAQRHSLFFSRWRVKDLASLLFSSSLLNVSLRDKIRFFHAYRKKRPLRIADWLMILWVQRKARRIALHTQKTLRMTMDELRQDTPHNTPVRVLGLP